MARQILTCATWGRVLTRSISRLAELPVATPIDEVGYAPTLAVGTWAVDPEPSWRSAEGTPATTPGCLVLNPEDAPTLKPHPDAERNSGCCRHDGLGGPNRLCPDCDAAVATLSDDCWSRVELRFEPDAVRVVTEGSAGTDLRAQ